MSQHLLGTLDEQKGKKGDWITKSILIQTMDKEESKFENKYFSSPLKKEQTEQYLCVFFVPALSEALRNMDRFLFSVGMQSTGSQ